MQILGQQSNATCDIVISRHRDK